MDSVAAVDWTAYEEEARAAIAAAERRGELDDVRVRFLGRKIASSRRRCAAVRDRESGMLLNGVRAPARGGGRRPARRALADARARPPPARRGRRRHAPRRGAAARPPAPDHAGAADGRGRVPRPRLRGARRPRGRDGRIQLRQARVRADALGALAARHVLLRRRRTCCGPRRRPSQIHALEEQPPPIYMVSIGRVYRRDAITATRYPIFHQFEGLAVDEGLTLADLKGTLLHVMRQLYGPDRRVRFRTHYFPFTEPSIEPDVSCGICGGSRLPHVQVLGLDRDGRRRHGRPARLRERRPRPGRGGAASPSAAASSAPRSCATTSRTSAPSGRATSAC